MRKLIVWNVITLQGFFEGKTPWDLDFHLKVWGDELEQFSYKQLQSADYLVFGRITYEGMARYWKQETGPIADSMNSLEKIVFSDSLSVVDWPTSHLLRSSELARLKEIKAEEGRDMFVFGSANLIATLLKENLVDEIRLCIAPVILGHGKPLFQTGIPTQYFTLRSSQPLKTGGLIATYTLNALIS